MWSSELHSSEHLGLELQNKAFLTYMVKPRVLLVPFGLMWGSGMILGHHTGEAGGLHSHPVSSSINKGEVSALLARKHGAIG